MNARMLNLIGISIIFVAVIIHIICIAEPHYCSANLSDVAKKIPQHMDTFGNNIDAQAQEEAKKYLGMMHLTMHFGLWKMCMDVDIGMAGQAEVSVCFKFGADNDKKNDQMMGLPKSSTIPGWLRCVQAMSIIGLLLVIVSGGLSILTLVQKSKGDRLRFIHIIILALCVLGGTFIIIGDIVFAGNYDGLPLQGDSTPNNLPIPKEMMVMIKDAFKLGWAFGLDIFAAVLCISAGVFHFISGRLNQGYME